jgi:hypothetical protein
MVEVSWIPQWASIRTWGETRYFIECLVNKIDSPEDSGPSLYRGVLISPGCGKLKQGFSLSTFIVRHSLRKVSNEITAGKLNLSSVDSVAGARNRHKIINPTETPLIHNTLSDGQKSEQQKTQQTGVPKPYATGARDQLVGGPTHTSGLQLVAGFCYIAQV